MLYERASERASAAATTIATTREKIRPVQLTGQQSKELNQRRRCNGGFLKS